MTCDSRKITCVKNNKSHVCVHSDSLSWLLGLLGHLNTVINVCQYKCVIVNETIKSANK